MKKYPRPRAPRSLSRAPPIFTRWALVLYIYALGVVIGRKGCKGLFIFRFSLNNNSLKSKKKLKKYLTNAFECIIFVCSYLKSYIYKHLNAMKILRAIFALGFVSSFVLSLSVLISQPFLLASTCDKVFAGLFVLSTLFFLMYLSTLEKRF